MHRYHLRESLTRASKHRYYLRESHTRASKHRYCLRESLTRASKHGYHLRESLTRASKHGYHLRELLIRASTDITLAHTHSPHQRNYRQYFLANNDVTGCNLLKRTFARLGRLRESKLEHKGAHCELKLAAVLISTLAVLSSASTVLGSAPTVFSSAPAWKGPVSKSAPVHFFRQGRPNARIGDHD
jgi:hypothetical protein